MTVQCETEHSDNDNLTQLINQTIRDVCKLKGDAVFVAPASLPNDGKVIEDARDA